MKTIKKLSFAVVTFVALSFSLSSCDAITDALSKEVEVEAPAIDFSIGGAATAPMQKVGANAAAEYVWLNKSVDIKTKLEAELAKNNLTIDKVKGLKVTASKITVLSLLSTSYDLGNIKIYIDETLVATGTGNVSATNAVINFTYTAPYDIFAKLGAGSVMIKVTSDKMSPAIILNMALINTYLGKVGLI
ncbi:MAG: hypothetical protein ACOYM7_03925 [Paludibacter sp.]